MALFSVFPITLLRESETPFLSIHLLFLFINLTEKNRRKFAYRSFQAGRTRKESYLLSSFHKGDVCLLLSTGRSSDVHTANGEWCAWNRCSLEN